MVNVICGDVLLGVSVSCVLFCFAHVVIDHGSIVISYHFTQESRWNREKTASW